MAAVFLSCSDFIVEKLAREVSRENAEPAIARGMAPTAHDESGDQF